MDFAENYSCTVSDNVQSSYWNQTGVTLHPCVIYYCNDGNISHKSTVFVSDVLSHNTSMVYAIIPEVVKEVRILVPDATCIHYYTDSPFSQYRNKAIFHFVSSHADRFSGLQATWNYFETGHGKGPCDGVGGSVKRCADQAVKQGTCIQDAHDFFAWASSSNVHSSITYKFITQDQYNESESKVSKLQDKQVGLKPIKGSKSLHAVRAVPGCHPGARCIEWRETSSHGTNLGWSHETLIYKVKPNRHTPDSSLYTRDGSLYGEGTFVIAKYGSQCYVGKVLDDDEEDTFITFMETKGRGANLAFCWPKRSDDVWVEHKDVLETIDPPIQGKRHLKLTENSAIKFCAYVDAEAK